MCRESVFLELMVEEQGNFEELFRGIFLFLPKNMLIDFVYYLKKKPGFSLRYRYTIILHITRRQRALLYVVCYYVSRGNSSYKTMGNIPSFVHLNAHLHISTNCFPQLTWLRWFKFSRIIKLDEDVTKRCNQKTFLVEWLLN